MTEEHNMTHEQTLRSKFYEAEDSLTYEDYGCDGADECCGNCGGDFLSSDKVYDWFLAQFDAMLAEDIGKIVYGVRPRMEAYEIEIIATKVLEDRRLSLKK